MGEGRDPISLCERQAGAAQEYLGGCPHLHAEGRIHPVAISYIQRLARKTLWENAAAELDALLASGAAGDVLIFMPGAYEIWKTIDACGRVRSPERLCLLPLHGELPPQDQRQVMRPAAAGRKVIVATNIAETSLTIPGVRHVIDSGMARIGVMTPESRMAGMAKRKPPRKDCCCVRLEVEMSRPTPSTMTTSPRKNTVVLPPASIRLPREMIAPPSSTALRCPIRRSAIQPPGSANRCARSSRT